MKEALELLKNALLDNDPAILQDVSKDPDVVAKLITNTTFFKSVLESANLTAVRFMAENGADLHVELDNGMNALGWAIYKDDNWEERIQVIDYLISKGADPDYTCNCHGPALIEALHNGHDKVFLHFLNRVKTIEELRSAVSESGKRLEYWVKQSKKPELIRQYQIRKNILMGEKYGGNDPQYICVDDSTVERVQYLSGGIRLSEVYNFHSCKLTTIVSGGNALNTQIAAFDELPEPAAISDAANALERLKGNPGNRWKSFARRANKPLRAARSLKPSAAD